MELVKSEHLFGMVLCDIMVPKELKDYFSEMTPIFKNIKISQEDVGEPMREYAIANKLMPQPRRSLIGSYIGNKILLTTPLLKWYMEHGLVVTHVYETVEYSPETCFKHFGESVSAAHRLGDENPEHTIIASTQKLIGNSSYGKCITNKDTHHNVYYCDDQEALMKVNEPQFQQLNPLSDDLYEVELAKKIIKYDLPLHIGYFVYQYAKLRMLEFYYDFLDKYLECHDYEYIEMDTDSAYIGIAGTKCRRSGEATHEKRILQRMGTMVSC